MSKQPFWKLTQAQESILGALIEQLSLPPAGIAFVRQAISEGPARAPQARRGGNCTLRVKSKKLNAMLPLESRTGEHAEATLLEEDTGVVVYFPQPPTQTLEVRDEQGRRVTSKSYTADFLVIRTDGIQVREVRHEDALMAMHERSPYQVYFDAERDQWCNRSAELHFAAMGIDYTIVCTRSINTTRVNNVRFLEDYVDDACPLADPLAISRLKALLDAKLSVPFYDLVDAGFDADLIFKAVADGDIYVDLDVDRLHIPEALSLYASKAVRELHKAVAASKQDPIQPIAGAMAISAGTRVCYGRRILQVILCTERDVHMRDEHDQEEVWSLETLKRMHEKEMVQVDTSGALGPQYANLSKAQITRAQARLEALQKWDLSKFSEASLERFKATARQARNELEALVALSDEIENRGNRVPRVDDRSEALIKQAIEEKFNTKEAPTQLAAFKYYKALCERAALDEPHRPLPYAVSSTTFYKRIARHQSTTARKGKRYAYQVAKITVAGSNQLPVHAVQPHEGCYIDGTVINLATVSGFDPSVPLHKPYLMAAEDAGTTQCRAFLLLYEPPSAATVLLVLRDYVRRHGRLPRFLALDNAKEFRSENLREFCRLYGIDLRYRPPGQPRGAAPVEALIGASEIEVISNLVGNTRSLKDPRLTTKSMNGFNFASHTLVSAYNVLENYFFNVREHRVSAALGMTPHQYEQQRMLEAGARQHVIVRYDENLLLLTSPHAKRPFHKVDPRRGVWVDGMWYAHADLRGLPKGTKVEVRIEPFAARVVYVNVRGHWKAAVGINSRQLDGRTRREVQIVAREHKKKSNTAAKADRLAYKGEGFNNYPPEAYDPRLAEQQREQKYLLHSQGMLGALLPDMIETGDDQEFDFSRSPESFGMHVDRASGTPQLSWSAPKPVTPGAEDAEVAVTEVSPPPREWASGAHDQREEGLLGDALEDFL